MKRTDLIRQLEEAGFVFERHGGSHDIYVKGNVRETIPRHREINEKLAKAILKRNGL
jgi:mRNA interferase HicA